MDHEAIKKVISWLLLCSLFITGGGIAKIGFTLEWFHFVYIPFATLCLFYFHHFSRKIGYLIITIAIWSLITYSIGLPLVIKQLINITFSLFVFYNYLLWEQFNYKEIFTKYILLSKIVLVIGFVQIFIFAFEPYGFPATAIFVDVFPFLKGSNLGFRFQSVAQEPSFLVYSLAPAIFMSLYNLFNRRSFYISKWWSVAFVFGAILTFSMVAYAGLIIMVITLYFKNFTIRKLSVSIFVFFSLGGLSLLAYNSIPEIKLRTDDTLTGYRNGITDPKVYRSVNLTTYVLLSNELVTWKSLRDQPLLGTGLGTYELDYDRYMPEDMKAYSQLNREDAGSMAFRLLTETGLVGFFAVCFFTFRYKLKFKSDFSTDQEFYWILNAGIYTMILLFLIRSGNYTHQGRVLFFLLYYYSFREARR